MLQFNVVMNNHQYADYIQVVFIILPILDIMMTHNLITGTFLCEQLTFGSNDNYHYKLSILVLY